MSEPVAPSSPLPRSLLRAREWSDAHPTASAVALYGAAALAALAAAYLAIFTVFSRYDDEGTLLVTLQAFVDGDALYRDIYSPYGPFYYELFGGLFALAGLPVSTNASRLVVVGVWVLTSGLLGLVAQRITGRLSLGVTAAIVSFGVLYVLIGEPMHPHGLGVLLLAGFMLLAVSGPPRRVGLAGGAAGALVGALLLTKVNLGIYALAAIALAAVLTVEPLYRHRWLRWPVIAAFLAMPVAVMSRDLTAGWVQSLVALEILAAAAIVVAAWALRPRSGEDHEDLVQWLIAAACGLIAAAGAILIAILLTGPSPADIYDGMVGQALGVRDALVTPFESPAAAVDWGIAAVAAAALAAWLLPRAADRPALWSGLLRGGAGVAIWFTITQSAPLSLNPAPGNPDALALALAWVAVVPPRGAPEHPYKRFLRVLLPALAVAQTLQVYPVSGSQMRIAALTFVPVGALCLADALTELRAWSTARGAASLQRFGVVAGVVIAALGAKFALDEIVRPIARNAVVYRDQRSLPFPNASLLHLPPDQVEEYERVVALLEANGCTTLIGYPNINSLYLWAGIEPPLPSAPGAWVTALDNEQQRRIVEQVRSSPSPCAIRSETQAAAWLSGKPRPDEPLVNYVFGELTPVEQVGEFEFLLPTARAAGPPPAGSPPG